MYEPVAKSSNCLKHSADRSGQICQSLRTHLSFNDTLIAVFFNLKFNTGRISSSCSIEFLYHYYFIKKLYDYVCVIAMYVTPITIVYN